MKLPDKTRHYYVAALLARLAAFVALVVYALAAPDAFLSDLTGPWRWSPLTVVYLALLLSMVLRLFPSKVESLGCQKAHASRYRPTGDLPAPEDIRQADSGARKVLALWAAANLPFYFAFFHGWLGKQFMVCLAGFYGVCDIVCILFFCPFQSWLMHNRCCTVCRIYDWDYLMLCTPLFAVGGALALSACLLAGFIFLRWELLYRVRRARFFECSNDALRCANCQEHLCRYKRGLAAKLTRTPRR